MSSDEVEVEVERVLTEAAQLVPQLIQLLEQKTDRAPLVAIAALEMASRAIFRSAEHSLDYSYGDQYLFRRDAAVVKALAGLAPKVR